MTDKKVTTELSGYKIYSQYILVGAAIGLYYGLFSRAAQSEPDYAMAVILAVLAGALTTAVRDWKKKKAFMTVILDFVKITAMFLIFLLALQLRPVLEDLGGQVLVIITMTSIGTIMGLLIGVRKRPVQQLAKQGKI